MKVANIITKYPPAVIVRFTKDIAKSETSDFEAYLADLKKLWCGGKEFNILIDSTDAECFPVSYVLKHTMFLIKYKEYTAKCIKKTAIVITNPRFKKLLDIVFSMYTPQSDMIIVDNIKDGLFHVMDDSVITNGLTSSDIDEEQSLS